MPDISVKYFSSSMSGAPVIDRANPGSAVEAVKQCLINGFGSVTADGVSASGGVVTFTVNAGHNFGDIGIGPVVRVSGCTDSAVNGDFRATSVSATVFTIESPGVTDGSKSGSVAIKRAPVGWELPFEDASNAVYRSPNPLASGYYWQHTKFHVDYSLITPYTEMTGASVGSGAGAAVIFPRNAYLLDGATAWELVADDRTAYMLCVEKATDNYRFFHGFGDMDSWASDPAPVMGFGHYGLFASFNNIDDPYADVSSPWPQSHAWGYDPVSLASKAFAKVWPHNCPSFISQTDQRLPGSRMNPALTSLSSTVDVSQITVLQDNIPRGVLRGIWSPWTRDTSVSAIVTLPNGRIGRKIAIESIATGDRRYGAVIVDLEGPW